MNDMDGSSRTTTGEVRSCSAALNDKPIYAKNNYTMEFAKLTNQIIVLEDEFINLTSDLRRQEDSILGKRSRLVELETMLTNLQKKLTDHMNLKS